MAVPVHWAVPVTRFWPELKALAFDFTIEKYDLAGGYQFTPLNDWFLFFT
jgi:myo-inositol catabolism protein IolC